MARWLGEFRRIMRRRQEPRHPPPPKHTFGPWANKEWDEKNAITFWKVRSFIKYAPPQPSRIVVYIVIGGVCCSYAGVKCSLISLPSASVYFSLYATAQLCRQSGDCWWKTKTSCWCRSTANTPWGLCLFWEEATGKLKGIEIAIFDKKIITWPFSAFLWQGVTFRWNWRERP